MQQGEGKPPTLKIMRGSQNDPLSPGDFISRQRGVGKAASGTETSDRTTIQVSHETKSKLDRIKQETNVKTYDDAIRFLLEEWRRLRPSTFGLLSGIGPFVRDEEEDSHRIRS
jgi:hypothetical protein